MDDTENHYHIELNDKRAMQLVMFLHMKLGELKRK